MLLLYKGTLVLLMVHFSGFQPVDLRDTSKVLQIYRPAKDCLHSEYVSLVEHTKCLRLLKFGTTAANIKDYCAWDHQGTEHRPVHKTVWAKKGHVILSEFVYFGQFIKMFGKRMVNSSHFHTQQIVTTMTANQNFLVAKETVHYTVSFKEQL